MLHTSSDDLVVQSVLSGGSDGEAFNDLQALGWPASKPINVNNPISQVEVRHGWIVDALNVTYNLNGGGTKRIEHGSQQTGASHVVDISADEVIVSVSGKAGPHSYYKKSLVQQITLLILNTKTAQLRVAGPFGNGDQSNQGASFQASGILAFAGYKTNESQTAISGLSFITSKQWQ